MMKEVNVFSLFSGIGSFEKALERKGIRYNLVNYCEFDKFASKSYSAVHNVPETLNLGDITKVNIAELEPYSADLVTYGFPCQDLSNAGKQRGFEHDGKLTRSGLFFYAAAIIGRIQPKVAICENVKALTGKKFKEEFATVLSTLEDIGYKNYWQVLNAKDYGIPQNRERVFIVSIRNDIDKKYEFPTPIKLELRLKDILEKEVDEKFYLSDKMKSYIFDITEKNKARGNGNVYKPCDINGTSKTITTKEESRVKDNFIEETELKQVGQIYGTEKEPNPQAGRIYSSEGLSPTLDTCSGGNRMPKVLVPEATKKGYAEAYEGDSINHEQPNSTTRRGRVGKQVAQTLTTSPQQAVVEHFIVASRGRNPENPSDRTPGVPTEQRLDPKFDGTTNTITTVQKDNLVIDPCTIIDDTQGFDGVRHYRDYSPSLRASRSGLKTNTDGLRIRKLTPLECWRLMGFDDTDFYKAEKVNSNTQLYKQAGNSIVVNVLEAMFENLKDILCD